VAAAFIATNQDAPTCEVVSLAELRQRSGVDAFPSLPDQLKNARPTLDLPHGEHVVNGEARLTPLPECA
jgi:hypothetical protein